MLGKTRALNDALFWGAYKPLAKSRRILTGPNGLPRHTHTHTDTHTQIECSLRVNECFQKQAAFLLCRRGSPFTRKSPPFQHGPCRCVFVCVCVCVCKGPRKAAIDFILPTFQDAHQQLNIRQSCSFDSKIIFFFQPKRAIERFDPIRFFPSSAPAKRRKGG